MIFGLFWLEVLLIALLWVAALAACIGRLQRRWVRRALIGFAALAPLFWLGSFTFVTAMLKFGNARLERNWFGYTLSLLLAYLIGTMLILYRARQRKSESAPAAATWRRGWLAFAWLLVVMMGYLTLGSMDLAISTRCALLYERTNTLYLVTLPPVVSEDQNAAPIYETAFARLKENPGTDVHNPPFGDNEDFDPKEPATRDFLNRHRQTIALLRQAATMPVCRFQQDLREPDLDALLPDTNDARSAANLLNLHARDAVAHGQTAEAMADAQALFGMSRHFTSRPTIVFALVGFGIEALGNKTLETALPAVKHPEELATLHMEPASFIGRRLRHALRGEERWGLSMYANMSRSLQFVDAPHGNARPMPPAAGPGASLFRAFILDPDVYVALIHATQHWATQPYYEISAQLPAKVDQYRRRGLMTQLLIPSMSRLLETSAKAQAADACAHVAVAMTRYRLDQGALPSKLDELAPKYLNAIPADPFDGHPLRLAVKNHQWIIYSVGPDGVDDGGADLYAASTKGKGDVIFTLKPQHGD